MRIHRGNARHGRTVRLIEVTNDFTIDFDTFDQGSGFYLHIIIYLQNP